MNKQEKQNKGFPSGYVLVDRRFNCGHPIFKGDAIMLAIFYELATNMAHEPTFDSLGKSKNKVPVRRKQRLTSFRTLGKVLGVGRHMIEPRIKKLIDGLPAYAGEPEYPGLITKTPCEKMKGLSRNDGMVITILDGAEFGGQPDTSQDTKPDNTNNSSSKAKANGVTTEDVDRVAKAMADKATLPSELDKPEFREAWGDFVVYRKQRDPKGRGMTERSVKMVLNRLVKAKVAPGEAVDLINTAIECNWLTVWSKEPTAKVVKRTGKSSNKQTGPEAMQERDKAACRRKAA